MSPIADMLIKIKNAQMARHDRVSIPFSKMKFSIAQILNKAGFVGEVEKKKKKIKKHEFNFIDIQLSGPISTGKIGDVKFISKPSRKVYVGSRQIKSIRNGFGIAVISTSKGLMNDSDAKKAGLGGEMLFEVW